MGKRVIFGVGSTRFLMLTMFVTFAAAVVEAQTWAEYESQGMSKLVDRFVAAAAPRDPSKQSEAPASASNSTALLDTSKASDLLSAALNLADLTGTTQDDGGEDGTTFSGTATAWALYSAAERIDPLDPDNYCSPAARKLRRLSVTAGREEGGNDIGDAVIVGVKVQLGQDACDADLSSFDSHLQSIAPDARSLAQSVRTQLGEEFPGVSAADRRRRMDDPDDPIRIRAEEIYEEKLADATFGSFQNLSTALREALNTLEEQKSYALSFTTKRRKGNEDEYSAKLIWEGPIGVRGLKAGVNAGYEGREIEGAANAHGGKLGLSVRWSAEEANLEGRTPITATISGDAEWLAQAGDIYRGQAKVVIPVFNGISMPVSVTIANQTDLIDEEDVRGLVGFTVDTAQIGALFGR